MAVLTSPHTDTSSDTSVSAFLEAAYSLRSLPLDNSLAAPHPPVRAILFDFHGTLVPYCAMSLECINLVLASYTHLDIPPFPLVLSSLFNGAWRDEAISFVYEWFALEDRGVEYAEFYSRYNEQRKVVMRNRQAHMGVLPALDKLIGQRGVGGDGRVDIALVNGGPRKVFPEDLAKDTSGLARYFTPDLATQITMGDLRSRGRPIRKKPLPDVYLLTLEVINERRRERGEVSRDILPEECLVFEDSFNGVKSAGRAGMRVVWVVEPEVRRLVEIVAGSGDPVAGVLQDVEGGIEIGERSQFVKKTVERKVRQAMETADWCEEIRASLEGVDWEKYRINEKSKY